MARGGYREKAGRKTSWASGCKFEDTKIIRVPISIANKLLDIAHKLDEGGSLDLDTKSKEQIEILKSENILLRTKMVELESKIRNIDNEKQLSILDITQNKSFTINAKKAKLITAHPSSSYKIEGAKTAEKLIILNPQEFWSASKYMVLVIEN